MAAPIYSLALYYQYFQITELSALRFTLELVLLWSPSLEPSI